MRTTLLGAAALVAACAVAKTNPAGNSDGGEGDAGLDAGSSAYPTSCHDEPPTGAPQPPPLPTYNGTCPTFATGSNTLHSSTSNRTFLLAIPSNLRPDEKPPVLFLWHWLKGTADDFLQKGQIQLAADQMRFIAVLPDDKGDLQFEWPFTPLESQARFTEEVQFFDDMLACVGTQFAVNRNCVSSAGVSAGALWTDQLIGVRSEYLSSFLSLSGGTGGMAEKPWKAPTHKIPGVVLWGGPTDYCGLSPLLALNFEEDSGTLENNLRANGEFFIECVHNCGHSEPPVDPAEGMSRYGGLWQFVFDHPYWLPAGTSPYDASGVIPETYPPWCGIGKASTVARTGMCSGGGCN